MRRTIFAGLMCAVMAGPAAYAQTAAPLAPSAKAAPSKGAPAPVTGPAAKAGGHCFRLPLSDVAFGTENATNAARVKLDEYAQEVAKKRNWPAKPLIKSNETVSCDVYLSFGPFGTEYRCLVTTTFCQK